MAERERDADNDDDVDEEESQRREEERVSDLIAPLPLQLAPRLTGVSVLFQQAAEQLYKEAQTRAKAKMETKAKNLSVEGLRLSEDNLRGLDGSVKKNTAFQRKLVSG